VTGAPAAVVDAPLRTVLVHLDATVAAAQRLDVACRVAGRHGADVLASYCVAPSAASLRVAISEAPAALFETRDWAAVHRARRVFDEATRDRPGSAWLEAPDGDGVAAFVRQSRCADLVVLGSLSGLVEHEPAAPADFTVDVLLNAGRPALVVPPLGAWREAAPVLVGWNGTAQAARALAASMPWLRRAGQVHVVLPETEDAAGQGDPLTLRDALHRHGVEASLHRDQGPAAEAGHRLQGLARELGCGLLVMGCFGRGRLRERVLGGATEFILRHATLPVLMAH
jgi:nucleotide-binding universal stress UspA family protein